MKLTKTMKLAVAVVATSALLMSCGKDDNTSNKPSWGPTISDDMLAVVNKQDALGAKPIESLTPDQARVNPSVADAVKALVAERGITVPTPGADTTGRDIAVTGGTIHIRIYTPKNRTTMLPVVVYYHGGGWVIADINTYDASSQAIAEKTNAIVVSVNYRRGPEFKFPTAHNDSYTAYVWALRNASTIGGDSTKMAVAGESAGGNLACNVSIMARTNGVRMPKYQVLVYPVASNNTNSTSYTQYANAKPLSKPAINWFLGYFLNTIADTADTRINLVKANLTGLPSTLIINAEIDPLQDDGLALANALRTASVTVDRRLYTGVTHEFFGTALVVGAAKDAQTVATTALKTALQ